MAGFTEQVELISDPGTDAKARRGSSVRKFAIQIASGIALILSSVYE
jgi:hypothetical protein